jgi:hypothetical protein
MDGSLGFPKGVRQEKGGEEGRKKGQTKLEFQREGAKLKAWGRSARLQ